MELVCSSCGKKINLPDEKAPRGKAFSFSCPQCENRINVTPTAEKQPASSSMLKMFNLDPDKDGAMVCHTKPEGYRNLLEELGYQVHTPEYHIEAVNNLRFNSYKIIMITEEYESQPHDGSSVLRTLQNMVMTARRGIFIVYIAPGLKSFDYLEAFALSVNAIVSTEDMEEDSVKDGLKRAIIENNRFFRVFSEVREKLGKI